MSRASQILLGVVFCFATALFLYTGIYANETKQMLAFCLTGLFCLAVALAFLHASSRHISLRLIGVTLFCAYAVYAFGDLGTKNAVRAVIGFVVIGIPCGIMAVTGSYPNWGWLAGGFISQKKDEAAEPPPPSKNRR